MAGVLTVVMRAVAGDPGRVGQAQPRALQRSFARIVSLDAAVIYVTHFSPVRDVRRLSDGLHRLIDAHTEIALRHRGAGDLRHRSIGRDLAGLAEFAGLAELAELAELAIAEGKRHARRSSEHDVRTRFALDIELNAQVLGALIDSLAE